MSFLSSDFNELRCAGCLPATAGTALSSKQPSPSPGLATTAMPVKKLRCLFAAFSCNVSCACLWVCSSTCPIFSVVFFFFFLNHGFQDTYAILQTAALFEIGDRLVLGIPAYSQYFYLSTDGARGEGRVGEGWTGAETRQKVHGEEEEGKKVS